MKQLITSTKVLNWWSSYFHDPGNNLIAWCVPTQMLPVSLGATPNYEAFHAIEDMRGKLLDYKMDW